MQKVFDIIKEAKRLIEVGRPDEAAIQLDEALKFEDKGSGGGAIAFDGGGSNPPGPGQPGHP